MTKVKVDPNTGMAELPEGYFWRVTDKDYDKRGNVIGARSYLMVEIRKEVTVPSETTVENKYVESYWSSEKKIKKVKTFYPEQKSSAVVLASEVARYISFFGINTPELEDFLENRRKYLDEGWELYGINYNRLGSNSCHDSDDFKENPWIFASGIRKRLCVNKQNITETSLALARRLIDEEFHEEALKMNKEFDLERFSGDYPPKSLRDA